MRPAPPVKLRPLHELVAEYTEAVAKPCLCGSVVIANPVDPTKGLRNHQLDPRHAAWSLRAYGE